MIISVLSFKGGQAKTTSAVHLAGFLSRRGSTALIDADINESALKWASRGALPFDVVGEEETASAARTHEHLLIDSAARPEPKKIEAIARNSNLIVLPVTPDALSLDVLKLTLDSLKNVEAGKYRILLTICPPYPSHDADDARRLIEKSGLPIFKGQIRRAVAFQRAALSGCLVGDVADPRAAECAADYEAIGNEILKLVK